MPTTLREAVIDDICIQCSSYIECNLDGFGKLRKFYGTEQFLEDWRTYYDCPMAEWDVRFSGTKIDATEWDVRFSDAKIIMVKIGRLKNDSWNRDYLL